MVEVTEDCLAVRIPLGPDDADNYIVGAHAYLTGTGVGERLSYVSVLP